MRPVSLYTEDLYANLPLPLSRFLNLGNSPVLCSCIYKIPPGATQEGLQRPWKAASLCVTLNDGGIPPLALIFSSCDIKENAAFPPHSQLETGMEITGG